MEETQEERKKRLKREERARYRARYPEKNREKTTAWRKDNPEKVKAQKARYYKKHPEKQKEKLDSYRARNPEKIKEARARYKKENPEKIKAQKARARLRKQALRPAKEKGVGKKERARKLYAERKEEIKARLSTYDKSEQRKRYAEKYPEKMKAHKQKSARKAARIARETCSDRYMRMLISQEAGVIEVTQDLINARREKYLTNKLIKEIQNELKQRSC